MSTPTATGEATTPAGEQMLGLLDGDLVQTLVALHEAAFEYYKPVDRHQQSRENAKSMEEATGIAVPKAYDDAFARGIFRAVSRSKQWDLIDQFGLKAANYFVQVGLSEEEHLQDFMDQFTTDPMCQVVLIQMSVHHTDLLLCQASAITGLREALDNRVVEDSEVAAKVVEAVLNFRDIEEPTAEQKGLMIGLAQDQRERKSDSIILKAIRATDESRRIERREEFLADCEAHPDKWPDAHEILEFLLAYTGEGKNEVFLQRVIETAEKWPGDIRRSFTSFFSAEEENFISNIMETLKSFYIERPERATVEELKQIWLDLSVMAPAPISGNTLSRADIMRARADRHKKKHRSNKGTDVNKPSPDPPDAGKEDDKNPKQLELVVIKKSTDGYVVDINTNVRQLLEKYVKERGGQSSLITELEEALDRLKDPALDDGTEKMPDDIAMKTPNRAYRHFDVWRFKPSAALTGRHTPTFKKTRVEFVRLDDNRIGILGFERRDDKNYMTHQKRR